MRYRLALPLLILVPVALVAYAPAEDPDAAAIAAVRADTSHFENLQVLPDDMPREQLIGIMRTIRDDLGVDCAYCHVRTEEGMAFPSDDKEHKRIARQMMEMTWQINTRLLAGIEELDLGITPDPSSWGVTCWTCHRGQTTPETYQMEQGDDAEQDDEERDEEHEHEEEHQHNDD